MSLQKVIIQTETVATSDQEHGLALHRMTQLNAILAAGSELNESERMLLVKTRSKLQDVYMSRKPLSSFVLLDTLARNLVFKFVRNESNT